MTAVELPTLKIEHERTRSDILFCAARIPGSSTIWVGGSDGRVHELDLHDEKAEAGTLAEHQGFVTGVAVCGDFVISGGYDGRLVWWDREAGEPVRTVDAHRRWLRGLVASPDGRRAASVADDMVCRVWDAESGGLQAELQGHAEQTPHHFPSMLYACAWSPCGELLATVDRVGHVIIWDVPRAAELAVLEVPEMYTWDPRARIHSIGGPRSLAFSPDGSLLAIGGMGQVQNIDHLGGMARLEIFQWRRGERTHLLVADKAKGLIESLQFHSSGRWLLAGGGDHNGLLQVVDLQAGKQAVEDKAPMHIHQLLLDESTHSLVGVGHQKLVVWSL